MTNLLVRVTGRGLISERDLYFRMFVALFREVERGGSVLGRHAGGEQRRYIDQSAIEAGDGMGEFAVEGYGAAKVDLLGHDKIAGNEELAGRKRAHLDHGRAWSHGLEAGREPGWIAGYLERDLEAAVALGFLFERDASLADIDRHVRADLPRQGQRFIEDIRDADELYHSLPGGGRALRLNAHEFAAFDCLMLQRPGAEADYPAEVLARARVWFDRASETDQQTLLATIMAGLPGAFDCYDIPSLRRMLDRYKDVSRDVHRENLARFLREVIAVAEECGMRMAIHPDDPPRNIMGLPRIVSDADDLGFITSTVPSGANGITFCTGSLGAGPKNDVPALARRFAEHIHFVHLRNVAKEPDGSFMEADHLSGDTDMVSVVEAVLQEQKRRVDAGQPEWRVPFSPDHGHELLDDIGKKSFPGYSAIGRLKGLAEIRGVMTAVARLPSLPM
jgi:mannonate dehydratase